MRLVLAPALLLGGVSAHAQGVAPAPTPLAPLSPPPATNTTLATPAPHYVSIVLTADINRPAAQAWQRIGKYCDIGEWLQMACRLTSGDDWSVGSVRLLRESVPEILVGRTPLSYTYTQPVRAGTPYNLYHGTLALEPVSARRSKLVYTLFFDNSFIEGDAARETDLATRRTRFGRAVEIMKILAEGGKVPPAK